MFKLSKQKRLTSVRLLFFLKIISRSIEKIRTATDLLHIDAKKNLKIIQKEREEKSGRYSTKKMQGALNLRKYFNQVFLFSALQVKEG